MRGPDERGVIDYDDQLPGKKLAANVCVFREIFEGDDTLKCRDIHSARRCCLLFIDGLASTEINDRQIVSPLSQAAGEFKTREAVQNLLQVNELQSTDKFSGAVKALLAGDSVLVVDGLSELFLLGTKGYPVRASQEPDNEKVLYGPREGFVESLIQNTAMLRRKIQTSDLKLKVTSVGTRTGTKVCVCYLDSLVNRDVLDQIQKKLGEISVDGVLDSNAITEQIAPYRYSPFPTMGKTERPDTAAAKILDGGIAILVDGSPAVLLAPYVLADTLRSADDYYLSYHYASMSRVLRYWAALISVSLGSLYIGAVTVHPEMLPTAFMLSISASSAGTPFPTWVEFTGLMLLFEMLREAGIRVSSKVGSALSIVGALVVGQAAVEARLISAPMVIVVGISAITELMTPRLSAAISLIRLVAALAAALLGFYGYCMVILAVAIHVYSLDSFGIPYNVAFTQLAEGAAGDTLVRAPMPRLRRRTEYVSPNTMRRRTKP